MKADNVKPISRRLESLHNRVADRTTRQNTVKAACAFLLFLFLVDTILFTSPVWAASPVYVKVDSATTIGNNKLSLGFMLDWESNAWRYSTTQRQLAKDANLKLVRLFSVRIEPCSRWYESSKTGTFNWANVDSLVRTIFEAGAEPLITMGKFNSANGPLVAPYGMATNPNTGLPYPESYAAYVAEWVKHFKAVGLPVRYYEIVNEPYFYFGWDPSETKLIGNFVSFFNSVAKAMRSVNSGILISSDTFLQKKFLNYFVTYGVSLDYVSLHKYGLSESGGTDSTAFSRAKTNFFTTQSSVWYTVDQGRQMWYNKRGSFLPVVITEANFSYAWGSGTDPRIQQMAGAVYTALVLRESVLRGISYHVYYVLASSASNQQRLGSGYGFGLINSDNNQPWYPYYVGKWLGTTLSVEDKLYATTSSTSVVSALAWSHGSNFYVLLISEATDVRTVYISGLKGQIKFSKIDNTIYWKTPAVQSGTFDSTQPLTMSGYTVALLQTQIPQNPVSSGFDDGFETGDYSKWDGTVKTSGETAAVVTTRYNSGSYSAKFTSNGGNTVEENTYAYKTVDMSDVYVRGDFYLESGLPLVDEGARFSLLRLGGASQNLVYAGIRRTGGVDKWMIYVRNGANWMLRTYANSPLPQVDKWISVELHWKTDSTQGLVELYINGVRVIQVSGINTAYYGNATRIDFGIVYASTIQNNIIIYGDNIAISKT